GLDKSDVRDCRVDRLELARRKEALPDSIGPSLGTEIGASASGDAAFEGEFVDRQKCLGLVREVLIEVSLAKRGAGHDLRDGRLSVTGLQRALGGCGEDGPPSALGSLARALARSCSDTGRRSGIG